MYITKHRPHKTAINIKTSTLDLPVTHITTSDFERSEAGDCQDLKHDFKRGKGERYVCARDSRRRSFPGNCASVGVVQVRNDDGMSCAYIHSQKETNERTGRPEHVTVRRFRCILVAERNCTYGNSRRSHARHSKTQKKFIIIIALAVSCHQAWTKSLQSMY